MAISVTNSAANSSVNSTTVDVTLTVSSNSSRVLVLFAGGYDGTSGPNYSSVVFDPGGGDEASFTNEAGADGDWDNGSVWYHSEAWYLVLGDGVSGGSYTITVTASALHNRIVGLAWEVAGLSTSDPVGASGSGTGTDDSPAASVTTTAANSWVAMGCYMREEVSFTAGSGDTEVVENVGSSADSGWSGYTPAVTTGTYEVSCTSSDSPTGDDWVASAVELLEGGTVRTISVQDDATIAELTTIEVGPGPLSIDIQPANNYIKIV